jgi:hypothetical protein
MLADWRTLFDQELQDTAAILSPAGATTIKDKMIGEAVKSYSKHRPQQIAHEIAGTGSAFEFVAPATWEDGFSTIVTPVEYPAGERIPVYLEDVDWIWYRDPSTGLRFRLLSVTPAATEKVRFIYTARHAVTASVDTVPVADRDAAAKLAASYGARAIAAYYAQTSDPTLGAESVTYRTKSQEYTTLANALEKKCREHLGLRDDAPVAPASVTADMDVDRQGGGDRLYHPRRWR